MRFLIPGFLASTIFILSYAPVPTMGIELAPIEHPRQTVKKVVMFDVGGILLEAQESFVGKAVFNATAKELGLFQTIFHAIGSGISHMKTELRGKFNEVLEAIPNIYPADRIRMCDDFGKPHPAGICAAQSGLARSEEVVQKAHALIDQWINPCTRASALVQFAAVEDAIFVKHAIAKAFDGRFLASAFKPIKKGIRIITELLKQSDIQVMILSNYAPENFQFLAQQKCIKRVIDLMGQENIFVSGMTLPDGSLLPTKPDPRIYAEMIKICYERWGVQPHDIIFIDNQYENVIAARRLGIDGLLVNSVSTQPAHQPLIRYTFDDLETQLALRFSRGASVQRRMAY